MFEALKGSQPIRYFKELALVDLRALAVFRISLGLLLLFETFQKYLDARSFLIDAGAYPLSLYSVEAGWWAYSLHAMSGGIEWQWLLGLIQGVAALFFILGFQTKIAQLVLWILLLSLHARNPLTLHAGDNLMRVMLFWSFFTPLQSRFSIDALKTRDFQVQGKSISSVGTFALIVQVLIVYFFTALLKNHAEWNESYLAIFFAMSLEQFTTPLGQWLSQFPDILKAMTMGTYYLELIGPLVLLVPFFRSRVRILVPVLFIILHLGLVGTMYLGLFPWICIAVWVLFFPQSLWDKFETLVRKTLIRKRWLEFIQPRLKEIPSPYLLKLDGRAVSGFVLVCLIAVGAWNVLRLPQLQINAPMPLKALVLPLRLDQYWSMFAPFPMKGDGWFVAEGQLTSGKVVDPWNQTDAVSWEKPKSVYGSYRSVQWRKFMNHVWIVGNNQRRQLEFSKYLCREWERNAGPNGGDLLSYELFFMKERSPVPEERPIIKKVSFWQHRCY